MLPDTDDPALQLTGYERRGLLRRAAPFVALVLLGFAVVPMPPAAEKPTLVGSAALVFLAVVILVARAPWPALPRWTQTVPLLGVLVVVALMRAAEGGSGSAVGPVLLAPVVWCALYGRRSQLAAVIVGIAAVFVVPRVLIGGLHYPITEWERVIMWPASCLVVGLTTQSLVARIHEQSRQLRGLATTDALTGLANRRVWDEVLAQELARTRRTGEPFTLCIIDLDDFKAYNDTHGHPAADAFLKATAARWSAELREGDTLARLGGDEFGLILPGLGSGATTALCERLAERTPEGQAFSAGSVEADGSEAADALLALADERLYEMKALRRTAFVADA